MELDDESGRFAMIGKLFRMFNPRWHLLKKEIALQHAGPYVEKNSAGYTIAIICRGEQLLYTDENGALVLEISINGKWVDAASITKWNEIGQVTKGQRLMVIERVKKYFETSQGFSIKVIIGNEYSGAAN